MWIAEERRRRGFKYREATGEDEIVIVAASPGVRPRGGAQGGEVLGWVRSRAGGRQATCPCGRGCCVQSGKRKGVAGVTGSVA
jgi:hypothetical protein